MKTIEYKEQLGHRRRAPWALVVVNGRIHLFEGKSIPNVVAVVGHDYEQDGRWSRNYYRLAMPDDAMFISGHDGWETGRFTEGLRDAIRFDRPIDRWIDLAEALRADLAEARRFLLSWRPKAAAELDAVELALAGL